MLTGTPFFARRFIFTATRTRSIIEQHSTEAVSKPKECLLKTPKKRNITLKTPKPLKAREMSKKHHYKLQTIGTKKKNDLPKDTPKTIKAIAKETAPLPSDFHNDLKTWLHSHHFSPNLKPSKPKRIMEITNKLSSNPTWVQTVIKSNWVFLFHLFSLQLVLFPQPFLGKKNSTNPPRTKTSTNPQKKTKKKHPKRRPGQGPPQPSHSARRPSAQPARSRRQAQQSLAAAARSGGWGGGVVSETFSEGSL